MNDSQAQKKPRMKKSTVVLRVLGYLKEHKATLLLAALLAMISNILALIAPSLSGRAIDAIVGKGQVKFNEVFLFSSLMLACYAAAALLGFFLSLIMINLSRTVVYTMRKQVFNHLSDLPVGYFDKNQTGDIISRLTYDIDTINASLSNDVIQISTGIITVTGSLIMMFRYAPVLMLIFAVTIPALIIFTRYRVKKVKPLFRARSAKLGELNGYTEEMLSGQKTIKAYGREEVMISRFEEHNEQAIDAYYKADYQGSIVGPSVNFINNLSLSFISMFGAILYLRNPAFTVGNLSSFVLYSRKFSGPINEAANIISEIQSATSAAERVFRLLDEVPEPKQSQEDIVSDSTQGNIEIKNVNFGYSPNRLVLKDISITIPRGSTVAVVGPTGSGKTTIINLLMRFYDIESGEIRIDGSNTKDMTLDSVRASFSMVLQDTWLFGGTIADNISYGVEKASRKNIIRAAKAAKIHDYISSLPKGYETVIDENGSNISKGQKQLITIARAILIDSPMIILDEATSNVDSSTEKKLQEAMGVVMKGKTSIVVAHRLSTIKNADKILVIKNGMLIEAGNHEQLMQREGGFYRSLFESQFF